MSKVNDGGPAFPSNRDMRYGGMTLRQYAAIKLRVPNSGTDWLDEMIRTSLRDEFAAKADDGFSVIFVPCTNKPATANWPHDDMGTPV